MKIGFRLRKCFVFCSLLTLLTSSNSLFALDNWKPLGSGLHGTLPETATLVEEIALNGGELYAVGNFTLSGTESINKVARWDGVKWWPVGGANPDLPTWAVAAANGNVYIGGEFRRVVPGGPVLNRIARWDGTSWSGLVDSGTGIMGVDSGNFTQPNAVYTIALSGNRVYVGGGFEYAAGGLVAAMKVAYWENGGWSALGGSSGLVSTDLIHALAVDGSGNVYVGGQIGVNVPFLRKWTPPGTWTTITGLSANGRVYSLAVAGSDLYVGGTFTSAGGQTVGGVAKVNLSTLVASAVLPGTPEPWNAAGALVKSIAALTPTEIYFTGNMIQPDGAKTQRIFCFKNGDWTNSIPAGNGLQGGGGGTEAGRSLAVDSDRYFRKVYVAGNFTSAGGVTAKNVAAWNRPEPVTIVDLGTLGSTYAYGLAVNNNGKAAGYSQVLVSGSYVDHGFWYVGYLYDLGGNWSTSDKSYVYGLNDSEVMVGSIDSWGTGSYIRAFRNVLGSWNLLEPFQFADRSEGLAINNNNDAVGFSRINSSGYERATLWRSGQTSGEDLRSLVPADPAKRSYAYGINNGGYIVGKSQNSSGLYRGFRNSAPYVPIGQLGDDLGTLGGNESIAYAINDARQIAGSSQNLSGSWRAFVKNPDTGTGTGFNDLGSGFAYAINNNGLVVGTSGGSAIVGQKGRGKRNLSDLLPAGSQWVLGSGEAVNNNGTIVGLGYNNAISGYWIHGFMITP